MEMGDLLPRAAMIRFRSALNRGGWSRRGCFRLVRFLRALLRYAPILLAKGLDDALRAKAAEVRPYARDATTADRLPTR